MSREERIAAARQQARDRAPEREAEAAVRSEAIDRELEGLSDHAAQGLVSALAREGGAAFIGPDSTPGDWTAAVAEARRVTVAAAAAGRTITYGHIRLAVYRATGKLVGHSMFGRLVMEMNRKADGVLVSSIVVTSARGTPGGGFLPYARSQGFDVPLETLQRQVFERFAEHGRVED